MQYYIYSIIQWRPTRWKFWSLPEDTCAGALETYKKLPENSVAQINAGIHMLR